MAQFLSQHCATDTKKNYGKSYKNILSFCSEVEIVFLKYQIVTSIIFISYIKHSYSVYSYQIAAQETFIFFAKRVRNKSNLNRLDMLFTRTQQKILKGSSFKPALYLCTSNMKTHGLYNLKYWNPLNEKMFCLLMWQRTVTISRYMMLLCVYCCFFFTLDAGLLARSQYSEGPATGHLDTGFSWFSCA